MIKSKLKNRNLSQEDVFNFSELFKLMKPRVMSLVIFTCAVGLLMAPNIIPTKDAIIGIILVSIGAGAAGALNMWYESDLDALMIISASKSDSYHMFRAPAAPAPIDTNIIPIIASLVGIIFGAINKPTAQVKITNDITLGFISLKSSEKLKTSS